MKEPFLLTAPTSKGCFKALPFIFAAEVFQNVPSVGLLPNMILYLTTEYELENAEAANLIFIWSAANQFTPVIGAFLADSYVGRSADPEKQLGKCKSLGELLQLDKLGWKIGFGVPAIVMFISCLFFFLASPLYVKLKAGKSLYTSFAHVLSASFRNRHIDLSSQNEIQYFRKGPMLHVPNEQLSNLTFPLLFLLDEKMNN
ncbi:putative nitrate transporter [Hibiscus syriacus]|uniref:Nitrate transporter n=1 Tax=Hibiscus syriacus TaxID=106335 RepID=A0A6A3BPF8_HIBSY|nr:putative nitrate transporter [Hibiscus syriacus]